MPIQLLTDLVIAQIAAGEVVERPASVVKELIENALDAGATTIQVSIEAGGLRLIRIGDNGSGIRANEVELAFTRHATSKLKSVDDLDHLSTLGFRGEALGSIAAVSQVTCLTRHTSEPTGTRLRIEGGQIVTRQSAGAPSGTLITIENLFYNVPARLKFQKKETTERRQISQIVMLYAMAYPNVKFTFEQDGRETFRSLGTGQLDDVLVKALGVDIFRAMRPVAGSHYDIDVTGFTTSPDFVRGDRARVHLFVNGRTIQDSQLSYAVTQAYQGLIQSGHHPICVAMIHMPAEDVDVNVHPTKAEVRFRDPSGVFIAVQRAVREALIPPAMRLRAAVQDPDQPSLPLADSGGVANRQTAQSGQFDANASRFAIPSGIGQPDRPRTLPALRVIGQIGTRYIVAEGPAGLYLVDQLNASYRVVYDAALEGISEFTDGIDGVISLTSNQASLVEDAMPLLQTIGLTVEPFGPKVFRVAAAPAWLADRSAEAILNAVADALLSKGDDLQDIVLRALCRLGAVQHGTVMALAEMQSVVRHLERCREPMESPDGEPTLIHFTADQLERGFNSR
jgi:DNA mismatch repair protein MutL